MALCLHDRPYFLLLKFDPKQKKFTPEVLKNTEMISRLKPNLMPLVYPVPRVLILTLLDEKPKLKFSGFNMTSLNLCMVGIFH